MREALQVAHADNYTVTRSRLTPIILNEIYIGKNGKYNLIKNFIEKPN